MWNCPFFTVSPKRTVAKQPCVVSVAEKLPQTTQFVSALQSHTAIQSRCSTQVVGPAASVFTSFSLTRGMFNPCKETLDVSPEEGQVEGPSYNFAVLLISSQLSTSRVEISSWDLLHLPLLCLKHPVFLRGQCYTHASKFKENTIVNTVLSFRNSSAVGLPEVRLSPSIHLLFLPLNLHRSEDWAPQCQSPLPEYVSRDVSQEKPESSWELTNS